MAEAYLLRIFIPILVFLIPFPFYFNFYREWTISLAVVLAGLSFIALLVKKVKDPVPRWQLNPLDWAMLSFLLVMILSLANTAHLGHSLKFLLKWSFLWSIYFLIRFSVTDKGTARSWVRVAVLSGVLLALLGIWQHFQSPELIFRLARSKWAGLFIEPDTLKDHLKVGEWGVNWLLVENRAIRSFGTSVDVIAFAAYLSLLFSFCIAGFLTKRQDGKYGSAWVPALIIIGAALTFSFVRGAWISVLVAGTFALAFSSFKKKWLLMSLFLVLTIMFFTVNPVFRERFLSILNPAYSTNATRLQLWSQAWTDMAAHPILGNGLADYGFGDPGAIPVHNNFLQVGVETGWLGLGTLLTILGLAFSQAAKRFRQGLPDEQFIALGTMIALVFFSLESMTGTFLFDDKYVILFMVILGLSGVKEDVRATE